ncbi:MAG: hypothetical protein WC895_04850 [Candidatus Shapirobacteria bacterium]|jgi:hypothetical protein
MLIETELHIPDPEELFKRALENNLDPTILNFDETHIKRARNVVEWLIEPEFLNVKPYPRQLQIAIHLCEDACPDCSDWRWLQEVPVDCPIEEILDRSTFLQFGKCPKCGKNRLDFYEDGRFHFYEELNGVAGQRSGKTALAAFLFTYSLHRFLSLPSPSRFFELLENSSLMMTFTAVTSSQAEETIWKAFKDVYTAAPWYKEYNHFLKLQAEKLGIQFLQTQGETYVFYAHKNLYVSFASPDKRTLRGRTRFGASVDEIGWFDSSDETKIRANSDETYEALSKSLRTIRSAAWNLRQRGYYDVPTAWMINISSPSSVRDKIMRLVKESKTKRTALSFHYATHEMNPSISLESLADELKTAKGKRDYLAIPPLAAGQFIEDRNSVERCITSVADWQPLVTFRRKSKPDPLNEKDTFIFCELAGCPHDKSTPRILTVDAGEYYNSFSMIVSRYDVLEGKMVIETAVEIKPIQNSEDSITAVHFPSIFDEFIVKVAEALKLVYVVYDRWQSTDQVQRLRDKKIDAVKYSATWNDHLGFRSKLYGRQIVLPKPELPLENLNLDEVQSLHQYPNAHLIIQCLTVREVGKRVYKPIGDDDDLYRCAVLADAFITYHSDKFKVVSMPKKSGRRVIASFGRGGGGGRRRF